MELVTEWNEFNLCRELGITPDQLAEMDAATVQRYMMFISAEGEAERIKIERAKREQLRGRK
ncbi:hypothetical protein [Alicyclobacillus sp. ALC3]|uniref:hypothetical protein n=1 Tax=Alicyclobacillus sp. ALC3 TaxID=2796143 RepID=UPI0023793125|nr:hypothetical protein [Alicyclobacillus sp. ALC3]WDL96948.1 hypothetical protein JC200_22160 [Alicyclobacillus sp. ALC3]